MGPAVFRVLMKSPTWVLRTMTVIAGIVAVIAIVGAGLFGYSIMRALEIIHNN